MTDAQDKYTVKNNLCLVFDDGSMSSLPDFQTEPELLFDGKPIRITLNPKQIERLLRGETVNILVEDA